MRGEYFEAAVSKNLIEHLKKGNGHSKRKRKENICSFYKCNVLKTGQIKKASHHHVPVIVKIVSEDPQQRFSKLSQSSTIALNQFQMVKQRLGREMHLNRNRRN